MWKILQFKGCFTISLFFDMWKFYKPFIKRVWWKRQLLNQFKELYPRSFLDQNIETVHYYEPFLWWWAVFFNLRNLLWLNFKATLSDVNAELINAYKVVQNNPDELIKQLKAFKYDKDFFMEVRARDQKSDFYSMDSVLRASRFIYLNRTCFNWMYRVNSKWFFKG